MNKYLKKDLKGRFTQLSVHKDMLFFSPIDEILSGFYVEEIKDYMYLWSFQQPLFIPQNHIHFTFGKRLRGRDGNAIFHLDSKNILRTIDEVCLAIDQHIKDVNELRETVRFYNYYRAGTSFNVRSDIAFTACFLELEHCESCLADIVKELLIENRKTKWLDDLIKRVELLLSKNREGKRILFQEWKTYSIKELGLAKWCEIDTGHRGIS